MLTDRQRMQIRRSVGYKHGFLPETVSLENHEAVDIGKMVQLGTALK